MLLNTPITRRRAISLALAGGTCAAFGINHVRRGPDIVPVADSDPLAILGHRYLETLGGPLDRTHLAVELGIPIGADRNEIRRDLPGLTKRSRADFNSGDVVHVGQWVLARTEAGVAALVALTPE